MIHIAAGLVVLSVTCFALTVISYVTPTANASTIWATGSVAAVVSSGALLYFVRRWRV